MDEETIQTGNGELPLTYKRGFEMGYWLQRGEYEKLEQFIKSAKPYRDFQNGLYAGSHEAIMERSTLAYQLGWTVVEDKEATASQNNPESEKIDPVYKKGFEHGYWLTRNDSKDLGQIIEDSKGSHEYSSGLSAGKKEADREKVRDRFRNMDNNKEQDKEKGIDI